MDDVPPAWLQAALSTKDLSGYSTERLCDIFAVNLYRVITAIIWAIDDQQRPAREVYRSALAVLLAEPARIKAEVARCSPELAVKVVGYVAGLGAVSLELSKRVHPGALAMWQSVATEDALLSALLKGLEVDSLSDYNAPNDPRDLQQTALLGAGQQYNREMKEIASAISPDLDLSPIETSLISTDLRGERWAFWHAARGRLVQGMVMQLQPLVSGPRFERIRTATRDAYRSEFQHRAAKKRGGTGGRHAKAAGTEQDAVKPLDLSQFEESIVLDATTGAEKSPDEIAEAREAAAQIIETARAKLGPKAVSYFRQLAAGESRKEAAKAASVSDRMARKYEARMRALLHAKKPRA